jgi:hypothetical protein
VQHEGGNDVHPPIAEISAEDYQDLGGYKNKLMKATPTVIKLAKNKKIYPFLFSEVFEKCLTTRPSIPVLINPAKNKLAIQVRGLNVPISKNLNSKIPGKISQIIPANGISTIPKREEAKFINSVMIIALLG